MGVHSGSAQKFLMEFRRRYKAGDIIEKLKKLKNLRVLIIGETILDEYHLVKVMGKSPKGTHIATEFINQEKYAGGVLACANHLAGFCDRVDLVTALGKRGSFERFVRNNLKSNVIPRFFYYPNGPTIVKRRYIDYVYLNKLFEIYFFNDDLSVALEEEIGNYIVADVGEYDLILVADYGHGLLTPKMVEVLCGLESFLAVNAQSNTASIGYNPITKYKRANYFCLGEPELHLAYQDKHADIHNLIKLLAKHVSSFGAISVTRGPKGSVIYDDKDKMFYSTPALSVKVVDTVGAGDAFLSITSACVAREFPKDLVGFIGNAVGSLAITILGNKSSIQAEQLYKFITVLLK